MQEQKLRKPSSQSTAVEDEKPKATTSLRQLYDPLLSDIPLNKPTTIQYRGRTAAKPDKPNSTGRNNPLNWEQLQKKNESSASPKDGQKLEGNSDCIRVATGEHTRRADAHKKQSRKRRKPRQKQEASHVSNSSTRSTVSSDACSDNVWPPHQPYSLSVHEDAILSQSSIDSNWICTICGCLDVNCLCSPCEYDHIFCYDCLYSWLSRAKTCPLCQGDINLELSTSPPISVRNSILSVEVTCVYCMGDNKWTGPLGLIPQHWRSFCTGPQIKFGCPHTCLSPIMSQHMYEAQILHTRLLRARIENEENEREQLQHQLSQVRSNLITAPKLADGNSPDSIDSTSRASCFMSKGERNSSYPTRSRIETSMVYLDPSLLLNGLCNWNICEGSTPIIRYSNYNMGPPIISADPEVITSLFTGYLSHCIQGSSMFIISCSQSIQTFDRDASCSTRTYGCLPTTKSRPRSSFQLRSDSLNLWHLVSLSANFAPGNIETKLLIPLQNLSIQYTNLKIAVMATKESVSILVGGENTQVINLLILKRNKTGHLEGSSPICWTPLILTDAFEVKEVGIKSIFQRNRRVYIALKEVPLKDACSEIVSENGGTKKQEFECLTKGRRKWKYSEQQLHHILETIIQVNFERITKDSATAVNFLLSYFEPDWQMWLNGSKTPISNTTANAVEDLVVVVELVNWDQAVTCAPRQIVGDSLQSEFLVDTFLVKDQLYCISVDRTHHINLVTRRHAKLTFYQDFRVRKVNDSEGCSSIRKLKNQDDVDPAEKAEVLWLYHHSLYLVTGGIGSWSPATRNTIMKVLKRVAIKIQSTSVLLSLISSLFLSCNELEPPSLERLFLCLIRQP